MKDEFLFQSQGKALCGFSPEGEKLNPPKHKTLALTNIHASGQDKRHAHALPFRTCARRVEGQADTPIRVRSLPPLLLTSSSKQKLRVSSESVLAYPATGDT